MSGLREHGPVLRTRVVQGVVSFMNFCILTKRGPPTSPPSSSVHANGYMTVSGHHAHEYLTERKIRLRDGGESAERKPTRKKKRREKERTQFARVSTTAEEQDVAADTDQLADKPSPVGTTTRWLAFLSVTCILIGNYFLLLSAPPRTPTPHQPPTEQTLSLSPPWPPPPSPSLPHRQYHLRCRSCLPGRHPRRRPRRSIRVRRRSTSASSSTVRSLTVEPWRWAG